MVAADSKDLTAGTSIDAPDPAGSQAESVAAHSKVSSPNGSGHMLKVRKPYTITKQREKWTEEEHLKFIEALKLYGRAWRQIEEHIGTKTAIQIRSHAQKFFAKVTRDPGVEADRSLIPIEIPPPRPKKKPLHPYPRKVADSAKVEAAIPHQMETSPSCDASPAKRENLSPTSVLSAAGSDAPESPVPESHKSQLSPTSCATDAHSANLFFSEKDNEYATSNISTLERVGSGSSVKSSPAVDVESNMEFEARTSIKLFGKEVVVSDASKQSLEVAENSKSLQSTESETKNNKLVHGLGPNGSHSPVVYGFVPYNPALCCLPPPPLNDAYRPIGNMFALPWYTWYQGSAYPYNPSFNETAPERAATSKEVKNEELEREGSLVGSNSESTSEVNTENRSGETVESRNMSPFVKGGSGKGFVPYKRCLAERDDKLSVSYLQEREGQRARVCS